MAYCGEHSAVKATPDEAVVVTLRCKSWTCPDCGEDRQFGLIANGIGGQPTKFMTLTTRRGTYGTPEEAAKRLSWAWRTCRKRLMRHYKLKALPFLAVFERHKSGWPHLHLLMRCPYLHRPLISKWMRELCDGPVVDIRAIDGPQRFAAYCAKYCSKCTQKIGTSKRYWQSEDYDLRPPEANPKNQNKKGDWLFQTFGIDTTIQLWEWAGYAYERPSPEVAITRFEQRAPP